MHGLKDKVVLVAGAATGLGAASAQRLAREGARVVVGDLNLTGAEQTATAIASAGGQAVAAQFDIADDASVHDLVALTVTTYGGLDGVHINAGAMHLVGKDTNVVDIDLDVWDGTVAVNLRGHMLVTRHTVPKLIQRGGGAIVYTSSIASFTGEPERPAYAATKAGINALARHVASRWGKEGLRARAHRRRCCRPCSPGPAAPAWATQTTSPAWSPSCCPTRDRGSTDKLSTSTAEPSCADLPAY